MDRGLQHCAAADGSVFPLVVRDARTAAVGDAAASDVRSVRRIVVLHITVIISGLLVGMLKQPVLGALLLVALKLAFDLGAVSTAVTGKRLSQLLPIRRFIISQEEDARRP